MTYGPSYLECSRSMWRESKLDLTSVNFLAENLNRTKDIREGRDSRLG